MKDDKTLIAIEAATQSFIRYGFKKTTMQDIAGGAGIARQTLYAMYPNKEAILQAVMMHYVDHTIEQIENNIKEDMSLGKKIGTVYEWVIVQSFELVAQSPDAQDLIDGVNTIDRDFTKKTSLRYKEILVKILKPHKKEIRKLGMSVEQFSDFVFSFGSVKYSARDGDHLRLLVANFVAVINRAVAE